MSDAEFARVLRINGSVLAADRIEALAARVAKLEEALRWYGEEAAALAINLPAKKTDAVMAIVTVLSLDGGARAGKALDHIGEGKEGEKDGMAKD